MTNDRMTTNNLKACESKRAVLAAFELISGHEFKVN
jgi:hypothetical protein